MEDLLKQLSEETTYERFLAALTKSEQDFASCGSGGGDSGGGGGGECGSCQVG